MFGIHCGHLGYGYVLFLYCYKLLMPLPSAHERASKWKLLFFGCSLCVDLNNNNNNKISNIKKLSS